MKGKKSSTPSKATGYQTGGPVRQHYQLATQGTLPSYSNSSGKKKTPC